MTDHGQAPSEQAAPGEQIVVIVLDKPTRANEVLLALANLQGEGKVKLHDAVIVAKDASGHTRIVQTVDVTPARGAVAGTWLGLFASFLVAGPAGLAVLAGGTALGALYGKLVDRGLDDGWVKQMATWIDPSTSALLLLVEEPIQPGVVEELHRFAGTGQVAFTTLPDAVRQELDSALASGEHPAAPTTTPEDP
jgi:uncharacterized membrane protein